MEHAVVAHYLGVIVCFMVLGISTSSLQLAPLNGFAREEQTHMNVTELYLHTLRYALTGTNGLKEFETLPEYELDASVPKNILTAQDRESLQLLERLILDTWHRQVEGDVLEAGCWRGGVGIYVAALMAAYPDLVGPNRRMLLADAFSTFPNATSFATDSQLWATYEEVDNALDDVKFNFRQYGLLSDRVQFVVGPFVSSLAPIRQAYQLEGRRMSVLRIDADMYESYMDVLYQLYDLVALGGYIICDDCRCIPEADRAVIGFRRHHEIWTNVKKVPGKCGIYWQKDREVHLDRKRYEDWIEVGRAAAAGEGPEFEKYKLLERLFIMILENTVSFPTDKADEMCANDTSVLFWAVPASGMLQTLHEVDVLQVLNIHEALKPSPATYCARVLLYLADTPQQIQQYDDPELKLWSTEEGNFMSLKAVCGKNYVQWNMHMLNVYDAVSSRWTDADERWFLSAWMGDVADCSERWAAAEA